MKISCFFVLILGLVLAPQNAFAQRATPQQVLRPFGVAGDFFGRAVAISCDTMVVSAEFTLGDQEAVHVYRWNGTDWALEQTLVAADGDDPQFFGRSLAIKGDTLLIGSGKDDGSDGAVYVFERTGTVWTQQAKLRGLADPFSEFEDFGASVALDTAVAVVGAPGANGRQGLVYVFFCSEGTWRLQEAVGANDGTALAEFGCSVDVSGIRILIGAKGDNSNRGAVYEFSRVGSAEAWIQVAKLTASDATPGDFFGHAVDIDDESAAIGAPFNEVFGRRQTGAVYLFRSTGSDLLRVWEERQRLVVNNGNSFQQSGFSVAMQGTTLLVGAPGNTSRGGAPRGAVWAYSIPEDLTGFGLRGVLQATDGGTDDRFGTALALDGDFAVVGAPMEDTPAGVDAGAAWVFSQVELSWVAPDHLSVATDGIGGRFGHAMDSGRDYVIIGAPSDNGGRGAAYLAPRDGGPATTRLTAPDGAPSDRFGHSVAIGSNYAVIGAPGVDISGREDQGALYVFVNNNGNFFFQQRLQVPIEGIARAEFGWSVALAESVGVGRDTIFAAAINQGKVYVFDRPEGSTIWTQQPTLVPSPAQRFGWGFSMHADASRAIIGSVLDNTAFVFGRSGNNWIQEAVLRPSDPEPLGLLEFGWSVAVSGGFAVVGSVVDTPARNQGAAYFFRGSGTTWTQQTKVTAFDGAQDDFFGTSVAIGEGDVLVGAPLDDVGRNFDQGSVYVFETDGTPKGVLRAPDGAAGDQFGTAVTFPNGEYGAAVGAAFDDVGGVFDRGSVRFIDLLTPDLSWAVNATSGMASDFLPLVIAASMLSDRIDATPAAIRTTATIDLTARSNFIVSSGAIVRPKGASTILPPGDAGIAAAPGYDAFFFGDLTSRGPSASLAIPSVTARDFHLGAGATLLVEPSTGLELKVDRTIELYGTTEVREQSTLYTFLNPLIVNHGHIRLLNGNFLIVRTPPGRLLNAACATFEAHGGMLRLGVTNFGTFTTSGDFQIVGGGFIERPGVARVSSGIQDWGADGLVSDGAMIGPSAPSIGGFQGGGFAMSPGASLLMPAAGTFLNANASGAAFACAIDDSARFDMLNAELRLTASSGTQTVEAMSRDIGPFIEGIDRTIPGQFPIGTLRVGPGSTLEIVDQFDNDGLRQGADEAIYCINLIIEPGATLSASPCRVYYRRLTNNGGTIANPATVQPIAPRCAGNANTDNAVNFADITLILTNFGRVYFPGTGLGDANGDGFVNLVDTTSTLTSFGTTCP